MSGNDHNNQLEGFIDEVGYWDRELSSGEMAALFFLSAAQGDFVADAQGAATLFDFYENGSDGDTLLLNDELGFEIVGDVEALGGTAGQSIQVGDQLLLGLESNGAGGLASFANVVPEPASAAVWVLAGLIGIGIYYRSVRRTSE